MYAVEKQHLEQKIDEFHAVEHELESSIKVVETLQDDIKSLKTIKILAEDDLCSELTTSKEKVEMLEVALISQKKNVVFSNIYLQLARIIFLRHDSVDIYVTDKFSSTIEINCGSTKGVYSERN